jgi:hypothetical protein
VKVWRVECVTEGREVYYVQAETAEGARVQLEEGDAPKPSVSEILSVEITNIEEAEA